MRCELWLWSRRCKRDVAWHARIVVDLGPQVVAFICDLERQIIALQGEQLADGVIQAAHPVTVACRHPSGRWRDDGCVLPVTLDTPAEIDVAVPA